MWDAVLECVCVHVCVCGGGLCYYPGVLAVAWWMAAVAAWVSPVAYLRTVCVGHPNQFPC